MIVWIAWAVRRVTTIVLGISTLDALRRARKTPLRLLPDSTFAPSVHSGLKVVYFLRHGESQWNVAQKERDPVGMFGKFDHALTAHGVLQAETLRTRIRLTPRLDRLEFDGATAIYCSPLTRAVQTALVALAAHPGLRRGGPGLKLIPDCRELTYPVGGFDSLKGENRFELANKVVRRSRKVIDGRSLLPIERASHIIDASELAVDDKWFGFETRKQAADRLAAFVNRITSSKDDVIIVVGHSLFFRAVFDNFASPHAKHQHKTLRHFSKHKLPNAAIARLTWNCSNPRFPVANAHLVFTDEVSLSEDASSADSERS